MKKLQPALSPHHAAADLGHFAWCALMALGFAQQDGQALSPLSTHLFLVRWLASAQKQRRFSRCVSPEIESLLQRGRQKGTAAGLHSHLEYLWQSCGAPAAPQSDLFRLTHAIEHLKQQGWVNAVVSDKEWQPMVLQREYADTTAFLVKKSELMRQFAEDGRQLGPVDFLVVGECSAVREALDTRELGYVLNEPYSGGCVLTLVPRGDIPDDAKIPTAQVTAH